jgi:hypothetical protein
MRERREQSENMRVVDVAVVELVEAQ